MKKESENLKRLKKCVDSEFISWDRTTLSSKEKETIEEYEAWGIVHAALYVLNFDEYNELKKYIYEKHGYDPGGVVDSQISFYEREKEDKDNE